MRLDVAGIGDSLMLGYSPLPGLGMAEAFAQVRGFTSVNKGVIGNTSAQILARFGTDVVALKPRYALIDGGINDIINGGGIEAPFLANMGAMCAAAKAAGIFALVVSIPPVTILSNAAAAARDQWNLDLKAQIAAAPYAANTLVVDYTPVVGQFRPGGAAGNLWDLVPALTTDGEHYVQSIYPAIGRSISNQFFAAGLT